MAPKVQQRPGNPRSGDSPSTTGATSSAADGGPDDPSLDELLAELVGHRNVQRAMEVFTERDDATIAVLDADLNLVWISRRGAIELVGDDPMQHEGRPAMDFVHPDDRDHAAAALRRAAAGETIDYCSRAARPGGQWIPLRNVGWGVDEGTRARILTVSVLDMERYRAGDDAL